MKITVNQLRKIIKEEVGRIFEDEDVGPRAERLRKAGSSGFDHPDFKSLSSEDQQEYMDTFHGGMMLKLPAILRQARQNAENNLDENSPKEAYEIIRLLNQLDAIFKKIGVGE